ncbi:MAG: Rpn family recombination-promoting nuclease/putative transposase [Muribaculaceae bacterium]
MKQWLTIGKYTTPGQFINPTTDPGFKILFGRESSKDILISLLNAILEGDGDAPIVSLDFHDKEKICEQEEEGSVAFDLHCETSDKRRFIVEMQNLYHDWFTERVLNYASRAITEQSKPRKWNYEYMPVVSIPFADRNPIFKRVAEVAGMENLSKEDRRRYESDMKLYHDYCSAVSSGHHRGLTGMWTQSSEQQVYLPT